MYTCHQGQCGLGERMQGHNNLKRVFIYCQHGRGHSLKTNPQLSLQPGPQLNVSGKPSFCICSPPLLDLLNDSNICGHCLASLRKHRPLRQNFQTWCFSPARLGHTVYKGTLHRLFPSLFGSSAWPASSEVSAPVAGCDACGAGMPGMMKDCTALHCPPSL